MQSPTHQGQDAYLASTCLHKGGLDKYVWFSTADNELLQTQPIRSKQPNNFGIFKESVSEWVADLYDKD
jgi:hypothetical protein